MVAATLLTGRGAVCGLAAASIALVTMIRPNGTGLQMQPPVLAIIAGSALLAWLFFYRAGSSRDLRRAPVPA